jgi:preprotein translocase subunit SecA
MLDRRGLKRGTTTGGGADKHVVLNAKYHAQEAEFVAQAGRKGAVTIATNMAGRGTDILLGGNPSSWRASSAWRSRSPSGCPRARNASSRTSSTSTSTISTRSIACRRTSTRDLRALQAQCDAEHDEVVALGGLHIVATERHEARRIDNQLRGRAGRQGDPGASRFYLSLEDDLMRIFGSIASRADADARHGRRRADRARDGDARDRARPEAGRSAELLVRKHLLEYDDVMNKQRENIYALRRQILEGRST